MRSGIAQRVVTEKWLEVELGNYYAYVWPWSVVLAWGWNRCFDEPVRTHLESVLLPRHRRMRANEKAD